MLSERYAYDAHGSFLPALLDQQGQVHVTRRCPHWACTTHYLTNSVHVIGSSLNSPLKPRSFNSMSRSSLVSIHSASDSPSPLEGCPATTVTPDGNGWVPPGTCGFISRPYYPSFAAAIFFSAAAAVVLIGYALLVARLSRRRLQRITRSALPSKDKLLLPWFGAFLSTCLVAAYILRAFGTRHQQTPEFVAISDTIVLISPIC